MLMQKLGQFVIIQLLLQFLRNYSVMEISEEKYDT